jgi:hypothetical protein
MKTVYECQLCADDELSFSDHREGSLQFGIVDSNLAGCEAQARLDREQVQKLVTDLQYWLEGRKY